MRPIELPVWVLAVCAVLTTVICDGCGGPPERGPYNSHYLYTSTAGAKVYAAENAQPPSLEYVDDLQLFLTERIFRDQATPTDLFQGLRMVYVDDLDDVQEQCGEGAAGCYWMGSAVAVIPTAVFCDQVSTHELIHHVLQRTQGKADRRHLLAILFRDIVSASITDRELSCSSARHEPTAITSALDSHFANCVKDDNP